MSSIPELLRQQVFTEADYRCEYCRVLALQGAFNQERPGGTDGMAMAAEDGRPFEEVSANAAAGA